MNIRKLNEEFYEEFQREVLLTEEDASANYSLKVRLKSSSQQGIHINLPLIKEKANYLQSNYGIAQPPKDCDAIIVDLDSRTIYLIEMKKTTASSTSQDIKKQLEAGLCWWKHLAFCMDNTIDFEIKKLAVYVQQKRSGQRKKRSEDIASELQQGFHKMFGPSISLEYLE